MNPSRSDVKKYFAMFRTKPVASGCGKWICKICDWESPVVTDSSNLETISHANELRWFHFQDHLENNFEIESFDPII